MYDVSPYTEKMSKFNDRTRLSFIKTTGRNHIARFYETDFYSRFLPRVVFSA